MKNTNLKTGARRLRALAAYLELFVHDVAFSNDEYARVIDPQGWIHHRPSFAQATALRLGFNATACALGHCALSPSLAAEGFRLVDGVRTTGTLELTFDVEYRGRKNKSAAMRFFHMTHSEVVRLFYFEPEDRIMTRSWMIKRLRKQARRMEKIVDAG